MPRWLGKTILIVGVLSLATGLLLAMCAPPKPLTEFYNADSGHPPFVHAPVACREEVELLAYNNSYRLSGGDTTDAMLLMLGWKPESGIDYKNAPCFEAMKSERVQITDAKDETDTLSSFRVPPGKQNDSLGLTGHWITFSEYLH